MNKCKVPGCDYDENKAMYAGLPMYLCDSPDRHVYGWGAWILDILPFNGYFITYTGSYWKTLWSFIKGDLNNSSD